MEGASEHGHARNAELTTTTDDDELIFADLEDIDTSISCQTTRTLERNHLNSQTEPVKHCNLDSSVHKATKGES